MIKTKEIEVDLGNRTIKLKIVKNSSEILMESIHDEETPVWVELWPSSLALARWIWNGPRLEGKSVMELGAGFGLPGIVAALKGAQVLLTDYVKEAMDIAAETAALNNIKGVRTALADWRCFNIAETFDVIIGSDIMYHPDLNPYLKKIFQKNLRPGGKVVMADAGRRDSLAFIRELLVEQWQVLEEHIKIRQDKFDYRIFIYQIEPQGSVPQIPAVVNHLL